MSASRGCVPGQSILQTLYGVTVKASKQAVDCLLLIRGSGLPRNCCLAARASEMLGRRCFQFCLFISVWVRNDPIIVVSCLRGLGQLCQSAWFPHHAASHAGNHMAMNWYGTWIALPNKLVLNWKFSKACVAAFMSSADPLSPFPLTLQDSSSTPLPLPLPL